MLLVGDLCCHVTSVKISIRWKDRAQIVYMRVGRNLSYLCATPRCVTFNGEIILLFSYTVHFNTFGQFRPVSL